MKRFLQLIVLAALILPSCKKVDSYTQFDMSYESTILIPSATGIDLPINFTTPEKETNSEATFEINDTRKELIETILLTELNMNVAAPDGEDFSFLNEIFVFISATDIPELLIASKSDIPPSQGSSMELTTTEANLKDYIIAEAFTLRVKVKTDELLTEDHEINVASNFFVDAKILGQ